MKYALFFTSLWLGVCLMAIPPKPNPPRLVNDLADVFTPRQEQALERVLVDFNDSTGTQILVLTVKDLEGTDPASYAFEVGNTWKVGNKAFDNGVVVLVKPKYGANDRGHAFIATGYGLEGVIPDAVANRIVDIEMIPFFKQEKYPEGIYKAVVTLMELAAGEYPASAYAAKKNDKAPKFIPVLFILVALVLMFFGRVNRARHYSMGRDLPFWTAFWMISSMNSHHRGRWNDFSSGGGSFGGFGGSGGGFGGFGGGSFGGGGAGGSW